MSESVCIMQQTGWRGRLPADACHLHIPPKVVIVEERGGKREFEGGQLRKAFGKRGGQRAVELWERGMNILTDECCYIVPLQATAADDS